MRFEYSVLRRKCAPHTEPSVNQNATHFDWHLPSKEGLYLQQLDCSIIIYCWGNFLLCSTHKCVHYGFALQLPYCELAGRINASPTAIATPQLFAKLIIASQTRNILRKQNISRCVSNISHATAYITRRKANITDAQHLSFPLIPHS